MKIAFDFDNTLHDLNGSLAKIISERVGYEVSPENVVGSDWPFRYQVDVESVLREVDALELVTPPVLFPGVAALIRELQFCGHDVMVVTARNTGHRLNQVSMVLQEESLEVPVQYSTTENRAQDCKDAGCDILIDDRATSCHQAAQLGVKTIFFGTTDNATHCLIEEAGLCPPATNLEANFTAVDCIRALRAALLRYGCTMLPGVLGLTGLARAGKDTVATAIKQLKLGYESHSFASPVKHLARLLLSSAFRQTFYQQFQHVNDTSSIGAIETLELLYKNVTLYDIVEKTPPGRTVLQYLGTEIVRDRIDRNFWVSRFLDNANYPCPASRIVITDVRFLNEAKAIKASGGVLIHVKREGAGLQGQAAQHSSEALESLQAGIEVTEFDNNGSIEELPARVAVLLRMLSMKEIVTV